MARYRFALVAGEGIVDGNETRGSSDTANIPSRDEEHSSRQEAARRLEGRFQPMAVHVGAHVGREAAWHLEIRNSQ